MADRRPLTIAFLVLVLAACTSAVFSSSFSSARAGGAKQSSDPRDQRLYGPAVRVGQGLARTYVVLNPFDRTKATEVGVALSENALEGLPAPNPMHHAAPSDGHEHVDSHVYDLAMPSQNPTDYRFLELDWNPGGHEPPGVYDTPHFDFHFYTVDPAVRDGIDPALEGDERFRDKSANLPAEDERPANYMALAAPGQPIMAVPRMGTHWVDLRTPELQRLLGHPEAYRPFTTTFLFGSWDGRFIFDEPMITRAFILGRKTATAPASRDSVIDLPLPARSSRAGMHPGAYRVTYDAQTREYRIALTQFTSVR